MYVQEGIRFFQEGPCVFFEFREDICEREREDVDNMNLSEFFTENPQVAIAFSGGVDSAYLLYAALQCGAKVRAYYVRSVFQPQFELDDGIRLAKELGADLRILEADVLTPEAVASNPPDRCYHCKKIIFEAIGEAARADGFSVLLDGTNASDEEGDRPGMRALRELSVLSPLRLCGLTKDEIRRLSREAGLFTWDKPAYACLATRIPAGERITEEKLVATEAAESYLSGMGFRDFRVRRIGDIARLQFPVDQIGQAVAHRENIVRELRKYYAAVLRDLEPRQGNGVKHEQ